MNAPREDRRMSQTDKSRPRKTITSEAAASSSDFTEGSAAGVGAAVDIEASQRYKTHWTHSSESLFTVRVRPDGEFEFEGLNPAHERRTGLSNREIAGKTPHQCLPAEVADAIV